MKVGKDSNGNFIYRSVLDDFKKNDQTINKYLKEAGVTVAADKQYKIARFPGRDTWWEGAIKDAKSGSEEEAKALFDAGYRLYGWDTEWNMNFEVVNIAKAKIQSDADKKKLDWSNEEHTHPFFNLYDDAYIDKDRVKETYDVVQEDVEDFAESTFQFGFDDVSRTPGKVILLMHERAFRYGRKKSTDEALKLVYLINGLKKSGFSFRKMSEY